MKRGYGIDAVPTKTFHNLQYFLAKYLTMEELKIDIGLLFLIN